MERFGTALRRLRAEQRRSLADVARLAHYSKGYLSKVENGAQSATLPLARRLEAALGTAPGALTALVPADSAPRAENGHPGRGCHQLPMDIMEFTGREAELAELVEAAGTAEACEVPSDRAPAATAPAVVVVEGMAGVGKTRLAVHAAHRLVARGLFPDAQLWTDLRGFSPDGEPADPSAVLEEFLRLLGVPGERMPEDVQARAALYRDRLAGRRALVVLDNAAHEEQVRPLLPGSATCLVLVTSRRPLAGLEGARPLRLAAFAPYESLGLLTRLVGRERVAAEPGASARLAELCGHLPIAVALAARRLQTRPAWPVAGLAERLESAPRRLSQLAAGTSAVEAVFDLSYRALPAVRQRFFRLLALHPGPDVTAYSAAALTGTTAELARDVLEALLDEHLLQQHTADRYRFHDLVRLYAGERARAEDGEEQCSAAVQRLLEWYRRAVEAARARVGPWQLMRTPDGRAAAPEPGDGRAAAVPALPPASASASASAPAVAPLPRLADGPAALSWMEEERLNLVAAVEEAARRGRHELTQHFATGLQPLLALRQYRTDSFRVLDRLRAASRRSGSRAGEAEALCHLGSIYLGVSDCRTAQECYERALAVCPGAGAPRIEAAALNGLGVTQWAFGHYRRSEEHLLRALALCRVCDARLAEAAVLHALGMVDWQLGRFAAAEEHYRRAIALGERLGNLHSQGWGLIGLGYLRTQLGDHAAAEEDLRRASALARRIGDRHSRAWAGIGLGWALEGLGRYEEAEEEHRQVIALALSLSNRHSESWGRIGLGRLALRRGRPEEAESFFRGALALTEASGHYLSRTWALVGLAAGCRARGQYARSRDYYLEVFAASRRSGDLYHQAVAVQGLGDVYACTGRRDDAGDCYRRALGMWRRIGHRAGEAAALHRLAGIVLRRRLGELARRAAHSERSPSSPV
ncbi:ATP-binding protein [Streptomyces sp. URMC 127]|uniref:ATP-binding protein n=1 Tax=Streptomyces sp. URMC 127 TaxID=3423402 RepID=UPI003F1A8685